MRSVRWPTIVCHSLSGTLAWMAASARTSAKPSPTETKIRRLSASETSVIRRALLPSSYQLPEDPPPPKSPPPPEKPPPPLSEPPPLLQPPQPLEPLPHVLPASRRRSRARQLGWAVWAD